jgi:hypothetical protein
MISRTKQAGFSLLDMMVFLSVFAIVFSVALGVLSKSPETDVKPQEAVAVKHELLQPVVTELKDYKGMSSNATGSLKLTPVTIPEMRKDPIQPVASAPVVVQAPQPIIEKNENHYHFEDLNSGITYLASILLVIFVLFCSFKGIGKVAKNVSVKKAIKKSQHILTAFETDINNSTTYLDYSKIITDQLRFNNAVIDQNKNSYHVPELSVVNDKLQASLTFTERSLVHNLS